MVNQPLSSPFGDPFERGRGRLPVVLQTEAAECGLACLAMVACHHGLQIDLAALRARLSVSLKGMTMAQLMDAAQMLGFAGRALRVELNELHDLQLPCVLHWDMNHFVVLKSTTKGRVTLHDPAVGLRVLTMAQVSSHFTGVALELAPAPDFQPREERQRVRVRELAGRWVGMKRKLTQVIIISLGVELCALLAPLYVQWTVDHALPAGDRDLTTLLALGFLLLALMQVGISALRSWAVLSISTRIGMQWSVNVLSHLLRLPQSYFEKRHLGDIVSRFGSVDAIQKTLTNSLIEGVLDGVMALITLSMMIVYSGGLSSMAVLAVVLYALLRIGAYRPLRQATEEQIVLAAKQQSSFLETVRGIQAVKLFGRENARQALWHNRLVDSTNRLLRTQRFMIGYKATHGALVAIENIAVVWLGAQLVMNNMFSIGMLFAFVAYKNVFVGRVTSLVDKAIELRMLHLQGERLADIVLTDRETVSPPTVRERLPDASLRLTDVGFRYSELDPFVLRHVSLEIQAGASVAVVAPSGHGKTTLVKLMLGLLTPTEGAIRVGGVELRKLGLTNYRRLVNAVMQDDQLFAGSVADNISFFADKPDRDRIEEAARLAHVHEEIDNMPMGYNTLIGDMGTALSGGQKQRVLLARALYHDPQILILDEATSHLDVALERAINQAIRSLKMTRIVIAHRPETIASCDVVVDLPSLNKAAA